MTNILNKIGVFSPIRRHFDNKLQKIRDGIVNNISSGQLNFILELVLNAMSILFFISSEYRKNIKGFNGKIALKTEDGGVHATAVFRRGRIIPRQVLEVEKTALKDSNVTILFKDSRSMADFLLAENPDILTGILENKLSFSGNMNYILRFVYLVRHIPVFLGIQNALN